MKMKKVIFIICILMSNLPLYSQVQVEAKIDTVEILIGQQVYMTVNVTMNKGQQAVFPIFTDSVYITPGVEVLEETAADTTEIDDNSLVATKKYLLTSFDERLYYIPPVHVKVGNKDYTSNTLALKVLTVPVDTLHPNQFFPPKPAQSNPFLWSEWEGVWWLSVLMILLLALSAYFYSCIRNNKPIIKPIRIIKKQTPYQKAMSEMEALKIQKPLNTDNAKEYYTRLTDTLRIYIKHRFGFNATEMTTNEIIESLNKANGNEMIEELKYLFTTADLVKFAKYSTMLNENDANLMNAIEFINATKQEVPVQKEEKPVLTKEEIGQMRSHKLAIWGIVLTITASAGIIAYTIYRVYLLLI